MISFVVVRKWCKMKVKQLIKKLEKLPEDAVVVLTNTEIYVDGMYEVTDVDNWVDFNNTVVLDSNHKKNYSQVNT